jgi:hypothetical protein
MKTSNQIHPLTKNSKHLKQLKSILKKTFLLKKQIAILRHKMSQQIRKTDTRNKIMMGGLVIKAGLDYLHEEDKAALLGLLIDAKKRLENEPHLLSEFKEIGALEFRNSAEGATISTYV